MKVLVTGGRGFIGSHIIDALVKGQDEVFCLTRAPAAPHRWGDRVKMVAGDVTDEVSLKAATRGMDCVVHCVQFPNHPVENPRKGHTYISIDGMGTARLVWACVDNGVKRVVYLSGAGTSPVKIQPWFQAKVMAEERIRLSGMEYVILRPSWVYGPEDRSLNKFVTDAKPWLRIFWAAATGLLTMAMLIVGGIDALTSATIVMGLPFSFVMFLVMWGLYRALRGEQFREDALRAVAKTIAQAHRKRRPVIVGMGAHVIKVGLTPILVSWMEQGLVTAVAMNGAGIDRDNKYLWRYPLRRLEAEAVRDNDGAGAMPQHLGRLGKHQLEQARIMVAHMLANIGAISDGKFLILAIDDFALGVAHRDPAPPALAALRAGWGPHPRGLLRLVQKRHRLERFLPAPAVFAFSSS